MLFNSVEFLIFFIVVFTAYWSMPHGRPRVYLLLAASYWFYMSWNAKLAFLVAASSTVDYFIALQIERSEAIKRRKLLVAASIVMNLGLLFYFKYSNFFLDSMGHLLSAAGMHVSLPVLKVVLPIGISFYTFEAISYTVDVYLRRTQAERNLVNFLLFITFFPRMVAGPIIRARNFLPQLQKRHRFSWARFRLGLEYVLMGLFKKLAIADRMACLADPVYQSPHQYSTTAAWMAIVAYSLQVYCDFSGYSDIALGTAHMLGFKLPVNFDMPYMSRNISEFWRRWHISLSTWLRDYVFISLGGSRGTWTRTAVMLIITMALCGLWHGARWTFVVFGIVQGIMLITHRDFRQYSKNHPKLREALETGPGVAARIAVTYVTFILSLVIFRGQDFPTIGEMYHRLFTLQDGMTVRYPVSTGSFVFSCVVLLVCHLIGDSGLWKRMAVRLSPPAWGLAYASLVALVCMLAPQGQKAFIYFQF